MILFVSQSTGQKRQLFKGANLGSGAFGSVFKLLDEQGNESSLVCKTVEIQNMDEEFSKRFRLAATLNEIRMLKRLGILEGYCREGDTFYIIMPEVRGVVEFSSNHLNKKWLSYQALRNLHRQNIAHLDAHQNNIIIGDNQAIAIDFNLASEGTYLNCAYDALTFFEFRSESCSEMFKQLVGWYVIDALKYAFEHKFETARNVLFMAALTISAIYGIPALYITNVMMWELFWTMAKVQLAKELKSPVLTFCVLEMLGVWVSESNVTKVFSLLEPIVQILQSCFSVYFLYSDIAYRAMNNPSLLRNTLNNFQDTAWRDLFTQSTVEGLHQASLIYLPLRQLITEAFNLIEEQLLPKTVLKAEADLLFSYRPQLYAKAKSFLFSEKQEPTACNKPSFV